MTTKLKLQIASDLHIETMDTSNPFYLIEPSANILILAGDIGSLYKIEQLSKFLETVCSKFEHVIYVPGNWEYYKLHHHDPLSIDALVTRLENLQLHIKNLHVLNKQSVQFGNICIAGCTLWSDLKTQLPKFIVKIPEMTTSLYKEIFRNNLNYIKHMISYCKENELKLVVVTHHCPSYSCLSGYKKTDKFVSLYASEIDLLEKEMIDTWICGHTHHNFDFINSRGTRLVSNQRGKPKDNVTNFKKDFVIEIDQHFLK
jgi:predicted phosphodiesterase